MHFRKLLTLVVTTSITLGGVFFTAPTMAAQSCGTFSCDLTITATSSGFTFSTALSATQWKAIEDISISFVNNSGSSIGSVTLVGAIGNGAFYNDSQANASEGPFSVNGDGSYNGLNLNNYTAVGSG